MKSAFKKTITDPSFKKLIWFVLLLVGIVWQVAIWIVDKAIGIPWVTISAVGAAAFYYLLAYIFRNNE